MIKANKGKVNIEGEETVVIAETMCIIKNLVSGVLIPGWGSKEKARDEFDKMIDKVFEMIEEEDF